MDQAVMQSPVVTIQELEAEVARLHFGPRVLGLAVRLLEEAVRTLAFAAAHRSVDPESLWDLQRGLQDLSEANNRQVRVVTDLTDQVRALAKTVKR